MEKTKQHDYCMNQSKIDRLERAAFGDSFLGEKGDHEMIKEIHSFIFEVNSVKKFIIKAFLTIAAVAGLIYTLIKIEQDRK